MSMSGWWFLFSAISAIRSTAWIAVGKLGNSTVRLIFEPSCDHSGSCWSASATWLSVSSSAMAPWWSFPAPGANDQPGVLAVVAGGSRFAAGSPRASGLVQRGNFPAQGLLEGRFPAAGRNAEPQESSLRWRTLHRATGVQCDGLRGGAAPLDRPNLNRVIPAQGGVISSMPHFDIGRIVEPHIAAHRGGSGRGAGHGVLVD